METQKMTCPECHGPMVIVPGGGGLFWRCPRCGKKIPHASGDLGDSEERVEK
jgi:tRNA(Ile2) C34 agmatinyltransferase TiaS